MAPGMAAAAGV